MAGMFSLQLQLEVNTKFDRIQQHQRASPLAASSLPLSHSSLAEAQSYSGH
jgi:hypothetical protein